MEMARRIDILPAKHDWQTLNEMAIALFDSGILPRTIPNAYAALAIIEKGRELGVPPMMALSNINMIEGKPSADAQIIAGLIYRDHGDDALMVVETTAERATVQYKRRGWAEYREFSYTIEEARTAGLLNKNNWKNHPRAMLRARAITGAAHMAFQDTVGGLYTADELGSDGAAVEPIAIRATFTDIESKPASEFRELCDAEHYNNLWHATVKGTRFTDDDTRHKFVAYVTHDRFDSLADYLAQATTDEAEKLVAAVKRRIEIEAEKATEPARQAAPESVADLTDDELNNRLAKSRPSTTTRDPMAGSRTALVVELRQAITDANAAGGQFSVPDLGTLTDDDIRDTITGIRQAVAAASNLAGAPA
jgi:hypothetical protein